jgi:hypothetical protein
MPLPCTSEKCANRSAPPPSGVTRPKPFASLNHFTIPVAIFLNLPRGCVVDPYGQARNEHSGYRSAGGALAQHSALLLRNARAARYKQHEPGPTKFAPFESCLLSRVASARPTLNSGDGVTARVARARLCGRHQLAQGVSGVAQARRTRACGEVRNRTGQTNAGRLHGHSMRTRAAAGTLT